MAVIGELGDECERGCIGEEVAADSAAAGDCCCAEGAPEADADEGNDRVETDLRCVPGVPDMGRRIADLGGRAACAWPLAVGNEAADVDDAVRPRGKLGENDDDDKGDDGSARTSTSLDRRALSSLVRWADDDAKGPLRPKTGLAGDDKSVELRLRICASGTSSSSESASESLLSTFQSTTLPVRPLPLPC